MHLAQIGKFFPGSCSSPITMLCSFRGVSQADLKTLGVFKEHVQKHEKNNGITCKKCKKLCLTKIVLYDQLII